MTLKFNRLYAFQNTDGFAYLVILNEYELKYKWILKDYPPTDWNIRPYHTSSTILESFEVIKQTQLINI
jgi:hypothetical protein